VLGGWGGGGVSLGSSGVREDQAKGEVVERIEMTVSTYRQHERKLERELKGCREELVQEKRDLATSCTPKDQEDPGYYESLKGYDNGPAGYYCSPKKRRR
jgi:hypothetical protein